MGTAGRIADPPQLIHVLETTTKPTEFSAGFLSAQCHVQQPTVQRHAIHRLQNRNPAAMGADANHRSASAGTD
ncbi:hypothetical protein RISK_001056 [Rhodopirellula islandica]|uniref:Uncharacterized protein n=1 Tax=Rhodopirellula islandica TaxID=595434 RepID=A0A0J1BL53_RHOIS|nr:hypothetical protein RISK_001056 [Rhodopirellula islandica]